MFEVEGKFNKATIYSSGYDEKAVGQIIELCNQDFTIGSTIRIMPDYHFGSGCTIGFTANLGDKVVPNLVGVDLGCGMFVVKLGKIKLDLVEFDKIVHENIPCGHESHKSRQVKYDKVQDLICYRELKTDLFERQIGTLGGGNHFIEVDKDEEDNYYLVIHSGSRNLGKQVADYYQNVAIESCKGLGDLNVEKTKLIQQLKQEDKKDSIQSALKQLTSKFEKAQPYYPKDLCFLEGQSKDDYLHDMKICQEYATENRITMAAIIMTQLDKYLYDMERFETIHNYIDFKDNIIRKGAVSAYGGEKLIIPMNMRDGSLLCFGKGNSDWNFSAPHGAGRLMSRNEAKRTLNMDEFSKSMDGIYSTTVNKSTLDEAPDAYKSMQEIVNNIQDTVTIDKVIAPVYNFKASNVN